MVYRRIMSKVDSASVKELSAEVTLENLMFIKLAYLPSKLRFLLRRSNFCGTIIRPIFPRHNTLLPLHEELCPIKLFALGIPVTCQIIRLANHLGIHVVNMLSSLCI